MKPEINYGTLLEAQSACLANSKCVKVQHAKCNDNNFVLCEEGSNVESSQGTCQYIKPKGKY